MIDDRSPHQMPPTWTQGPADPRRRAASDRALDRFLGGSPLAVLVKLLVVSLLVGVLLMWLNIRPLDVFRLLSDFADRLWALGLDGIREFGTYIVAGGAIVVPLWLLSRVLSYRSPR